MTHERSASTQTVTTTCGYCGVGCRLEAHVARRQGRLDQPRARRARQRGPHVRQGPLRPPVLARARPPDDAADPRGRRLAAATWDEAIGADRRGAGADQGRARPRRDRRPRLLARDERGLLRMSAADARRDRHATTSTTARASATRRRRSRCASRSGSRARPAPSTTSTTPTRRSSSAPTRPRAIRSSARGSSRRRCAGMRLVTDRPAPDRARRLRRPAPRAAPGHQRRGDARARARRSSRDGLVDRAFVDGAHRGLRRGRASCSRVYTPEAVEEITGVPAADLEAAAHIYGEAESACDLVGPRRHRAQVRLRGRAADLQPRADDRQGRPPRLGAAAAARPEQRAGLLRHGRAAGHVHGLPLGRRRGGRAQLRGRAGACRSRARRATRSRRCSTPRSRAT